MYFTNNIIHLTVKEVVVETQCKPELNEMVRSDAKSVAGIMESISIISKTTQVVVDSPLRMFVTKKTLMQLPKSRRFIV